ncbi:uncharacterized protein LOC135322751 [Camelus dromedarius]|uniref:Uncharacterized protein LOC105066159 n=1 Tax=Camelus bactrianus TaxID=9837 RepID=A0AC58RJQ0_CAMBA
MSVLTKKGPKRELDALELLISRAGKVLHITAVIPHKSKASLLGPGEKAKIMAEAEDLCAKELVGYSALLRRQAASPGSMPASGDTEALAVEPGVFGSGAGLPESKRPARPPTRAPLLPTPVPVPGSFLLAGAAGTYLGPAVAGGDPPGAAQRPVLQPPTPRVTRRERLQNGLAAPTGPRPNALLPPHFGPPPQPGFAFVPPPGSSLSLGEGVGERRRESFRCLQPPQTTATTRGAPGRGEGLELRASLTFRGAARVREAPFPRRLEADVDRADPRAWPGPSAGNGRRCRPGWSRLGRKSARNEMVGFGLLYFFFCSLHFQEQKKKPNPSHRFICISLDQKPGHSGLRGRRQLSAPHPTIQGGWDGHSCWDQRQGSSQRLQPEHNQNKVYCLSNLAPISLQTLG